MKVKTNLKKNEIAFESAKEFLMTVEKPMIEKRPSERIKDMTSCKPYTKSQDIPENKKIFINGFKHNETDKIDNYIIIGCESDELYEKDKLFNFWSTNFINKEIEMRKLEITGLIFMTLVKRNKFFEKSRPVFVIEHINLISNA